MNYETWLKEISVHFTGDPLWRIEAYRLALFLTDVGWRDVTKLARDTRTLEVSNQLYRGLGSIGANIAEGYSRGGGRDRARFYEYALGSARESRGWYFNSRFVLGDTVAGHRIALVTQIIRLLMMMIPDQRTVTFKEESPDYQIASEQDYVPFDPEALKTLIANVPIS